MAADGALDLPLPGGGHAPDHGQIMPVDAPGGEIGRQGLMGGIVLGRHQQAAGVLVQPVDDPRPALAPDAREGLPAMGDQGIDQGLVRIAGGGMDDHPRRLVDDDEILVLIDDGKIHGLAQGRGRGDRGQVEPEDLPGFDLLGRVG